MKKNMLVIKTDGTIEVKDHGGLESLQSAVGGYIEGISIGSAAMMYCNEEGKCNSLPVNWVASRLFEKVHGMSDVIVGDVVIVGCFSPDGEYDGEDYDVPPGVVSEAQRFAAELKPRCGVN